jgi:hypothetical protein
MNFKPDLISPPANPHILFLVCNGARLAEYVRTGSVLRGSVKGMRTINTSSAQFLAMLEARCGAFDIDISARQCLGRIA